MLFLPVSAETLTSASLLPFFLVSFPVDLSSFFEDLSSFSFLFLPWSGFAVI
jgi:hypothetical protein